MIVWHEWHFHIEDTSYRSVLVIAKARKRCRFQDIKQLQERISDEKSGELLKEQFYSLHPR